MFPHQFIDYSFYLASDASNQEAIHVDAVSVQEQNHNHNNYSHSLILPCAFDDVLGGNATSSDSSMSSSSDNSSSSSSSSSNCCSGEDATTVTGSLPNPGRGNALEVPFSGDFEAGSWNSQALFAAKCHLQFPKMRHAMRLFRQNDIQCLQETHATEGKARAFEIPSDSCAFWSHGTSRKAGICVMIKHSFLQLFNSVDPDRDWEIVIPGRVGILHLKGPLGNFDIVCLYLDAHSTDDRCRAMRKLANRLRSHLTTLTMLVGDFNFVAEDQGRWSSRAERYAMNGDAREAEFMQEHLLNRFKFAEVQQDQYTCEVKQARAKLDRVYLNQHVSHQLDKHCIASVGRWVNDLSAHRSIRCCRSSPPFKSLSSPVIQPWVTKHKDFATRVAVDFQHKLIGSPNPASPITRLLVLKQAVASVHDGIIHDREVVMAESVEDRLGWCLIYVKAIERYDWDRAEQACRSYPHLRGCGKLPADYVSCLQPQAMTTHIQTVRDHIVELAREEIAQEVHALQAQHGNGEDGDRVGHKEHILRKLKRLSPGEASSIQNIQDDQGEVHSDPRAMAKALCDHWKTVFGHVSCNVDLLHKWLTDLFPSGAQGGWETCLSKLDPSAWRVKREHVAKAVKFAKHSMPGPDGMPACVFKALGDLAIDILFGVTEVLSCDNAIEQLTEAYEAMGHSAAQAFNISILCCLPKKPSGVDDRGEVFYKPGATRPLNVGNVDNRLIASAARLAWEPNFEKFVSKMQRGFLKGRQMLHNVIDIDYAAMTISLKHEFGGLLLFDFKAAFPSVAHEFLLECLECLGVPPKAMNIIRAIYNNNSCYIRVRGEDYGGFAMNGGVRQGCPLSPILFAVCVDIILRKLELHFGDSICRAFADDIALVITDWMRQGPGLQTLFAEFANISNLHLNVDKTLCIPLWPGGVPMVRESISVLIPEWGDMLIQDRGTYLGFVTGPGKAHDSWRKPFEKYRDRVSRWSQLGGGMQYATLSYNVFALTTLLYVGQLEALPGNASKEEAAAFRKMFPGPGQWGIPEDFWYLQEHFGLAKSAQPLCLSVRAAQFRVACLGCHFGCMDVSARQLQHRGRDSIFSRHLELKYVRSITEYPRRAFQWKDWYDNNHCTVLVKNVWHLEGLGISPNSIYFGLTAKSFREWEDKDLLKVKRGFQRSSLIALKKAAAPCPVERIRDKTERWRDKPYGITGVPRLSASLIHRHLNALSFLVTPRIQSAVFHTVWNGWTTERRFQRRRGPKNVCLLGCSITAEDAVEHYCRCPVVLKAAHCVLRISYPPELALDVWTLNTSWVDDECHLVCVGILIYGTYCACNQIRHQGISGAEQAYDCLVQNCKRATAGHPPTMKLLDSAWIRPVSHMC